MNEAWRICTGKQRKQQAGSWGMQHQGAKALGSRGCGCPFSQEPPLASQAAQQRPSDGQAKRSHLGTRAPS